MRKVRAASAALALLTAPAAAEMAPASPHLRAATRLFALARAGDYRGMDALFDGPMGKAFPVEKRKELFDGLRAEHGDLKTLDAPRRVHPQFALVAARFERGSLDLKLSLDGRNRISGLYFQPHAAPLSAPERNSVALRAPFRGRWLVFWGGDTREQNAHLDHPNQTGAFDFLGVGPDGKTSRGEGRSNEDFYAFGREVLAPADGEVTDVVSGVRDNAPGSMNQYSALGNAVVIRHSGQEYSVLAHLKLHSARVKPGDKVRAGQVVGLCGNSGNSSEPHLHYHLQNTPVIQDGTGVKAFFSGLKGKTAPHSPAKGEILDAL